MDQASSVFRDPISPGAGIGDRRQGGRDPDDFIKTKTVFAPGKKSIAAKFKEIRDHNDAVRKRMDAGEDAEHELLPEPVWAHLERDESSIRIK